MGFNKLFENALRETHIDCAFFLWDSGSAANSVLCSSRRHFLSRQRASYSRPWDSRLLALVVALISRATLASFRNSVVVCVYLFLEPAVESLAAEFCSTRRFLRVGRSLKSRTIAVSCWSCSYAQCLKIFFAAPLHIAPSEPHDCSFSLRVCL
jgi:hypothetical protein